VLAAAPSIEPLSSLAEIPTGRAAVVAHVVQEGALGDRLLEMGLTPGATVEVVRRAPFGDPLQVRVRGYLLAIRRAQAARVVVRPLPTAERPSR
jgi:Fe2+ transport system protein FeoA